MRGHLVQRGDRYDAVVDEGIDPATGKERHRWYPAGTTRRGAEKVLGDLVKRIHDGDDRAPERITLGDYLRRRESSRWRLRSGPRGPTDPVDVRRSRTSTALRTQISAVSDPSTDTWDVTTPSVRWRYRLTTISRSLWPSRSATSRRGTSESTISDATV